MRKLAPALVVALAGLVACTSVPQAAAPTPTPSASASVLGATFGAAPVVPLDQLDVCTALAVVEIQDALGVRASSPRLGSPAPACTWSLDAGGELTIAVAAAQAFAPDALSVVVEDVGSAAAFAQTADAATIWVRSDGRDRSMTIAVSGAAGQRGALESLARTLILRI